MTKSYNKYIYLLSILSFLNAQDIIPANPFSILFYEQEQYINKVNQKSLLLRPLVDISINRKWSIIAKNEFFFSDNGPNMENMGNRWMGKGMGYFSSINFSFINKYIIIKAEPFYLINENNDIQYINRNSPYENNPDLFNVLNDNRSFKSKPYKSYGFRESSILFHYKEYVFGISNTNMWWGPAIHSSLTMTNNTTAFPHLIIGTINEKKINNIGINLRYIFTELRKVPGNPYYTALAISVKFYTNPSLSIGISRNYLSGGLPTDRPFTAWDAAKLPFEWLFIDSKIENYPTEWKAHDRWDQTMSGFIVFDFPKSGLKLYMELGTDDHRQNWSDLRSQPEHNSANIIGLRKYSLFNNDYLFGGFEYINIKQSFTSKFRGGGHWWWSGSYDYSTYDGRRWAAHSGSDSDDFYLFFGYNAKRWTLIPGFNYERHGIIFGDKPEVKIELRIDLRFIYNEYHLNIYFEHELINNFSFLENNRKHSNIIWFGIRKDLSSK